MPRLLLPLLFAVLLLAHPAHAGESYAPDDLVYLDLATEGFVTTQTARVTVTVDSAATDAQSGDLRETMQKAVAGLVKGDWRLTGINRVSDETGLTRWQATYEARLAEGALSGLSERAQKLSKPGMQLRIADIDFTPTLAETEARRAELRADLYKRANEELARLNASLPGRGYRIAGISFGDASGGPQPVSPPMMMRSVRAAPMAEAAMPGAGGNAGEVAAHIDLTARVSFAARPLVPAVMSPAMPPASPPK